MGVDVSPISRWGTSTSSTLPTRGSKALALSFPYAWFHFGVSASPHLLRRACPIVPGFAPSVQRRILGARTGFRDFGYPGCLAPNSPGTDLEPIEGAPAGLPTADHAAAWRDTPSCLPFMTCDWIDLAPCIKGPGPPPGGHAEKPGGSVLGIWAAPCPR